MGAFKFSIYEDYNSAPNGIIVMGIISHSSIYVFTIYY